MHGRRSPKKWTVMVNILSLFYHFSNIQAYTVVQIKFDYVIDDKLN